MTLFTRLESSVSRTSRMIALIGLAGLLALAFATVLDVLCRWLLNAPITGVRDLSALFVAIIIAASFPMCFANRNNITIRFLGTFLGPWYREFLDLFGNILTLVVLSLMAWKFWIYAGQLAKSNETTWVLCLPVAPWYYMVAALITACFFVQIFVVFQSIRWLIRNNRSKQQG